MGIRLLSYWSTVGHVECCWSGGRLCCTDNTGQGANAVKVPIFTARLVNSLCNIISHGKVTSHERNSGVEGRIVPPETLWRSSVYIPDMCTRLSSETQVASSVSN